MLLDRRSIGLVEDDPIMGESLAERLSLEGAQVNWWQSHAAALDGLRSTRVDLVICDMRLPDGTGEDVFRFLSTDQNPPPFLFVTAFGEIDEAVRLMRIGAGDYLTKPFDMGTFLKRVEHLLRPLETEEGAVLGMSVEIRTVERLLRRAARLSTTVLLTGETGTGKEVCARFLHDLRAPRQGPFVAVNCAAIPKDLMEAELFGYEKGSFTGASARHLGYAERADHGTLFLDEIGELDPKLQAKLLRLLEDRSFQRIGGRETISFEGRVVCATNADLEARVSASSFREDLYYRINVINVAIPPLRDRAEDIEWLAECFLDRFAEEQGVEISGFGALAMEALLAHDWPGNARELRNRVERAVALGIGPSLQPGDLFPERGRRDATRSSAGLDSLEAVRDEAERRQILRALRQTNGAILPAAAALGISRTTMWEKMRRHGIDGASAA
jgi:DNA-binding NtrC family response regulator